MKKRNGISVKNIVITAIFAALTFTLTMVHVPSPASGGYIHLGDSMIYLAASILPFPYASLPGAIGGGLADLLSGAVQYMAFTIIIKALLTIPFTAKKEKIIGTQNIIALFIGCFITVGGYFGCGWILNGLGGAIAEIPGNLFQAIGSGIIYILLAVALDAVKIKNKLKGGN